MPVFLSFHIEEKRKKDPTQNHLESPSVSGGKIKSINVVFSVEFKFNYGFIIIIRTA